MARLMQKRAQADDSLFGNVARERWSDEGASDAEAEAGLSGEARTTPDDPPDDRLAWLVRTIETEIIPRLMLAHQAPACGDAVPGGGADGISAADVAAFASQVLLKEAGAALAHVESMRADGTALETIYLELLAPTARRLGVMWDEDLCDFTEVTVGLWRLQQVMYDLSPVFQSHADKASAMRRAMLVPAPGSQHTFGLFMVAEFFRRAGWDVRGEPTVSATALVEATRRDWFDLVGLSVGTDLHIDALASVILALRKASLNPTIAVMVGGPVFVAHPEYLAMVGADGTASDAPQAILEAESLVASRERRR